jgi:cobalt-zinc-cadmium efflux system protein
LGKIGDSMHDHAHGERLRANRRTLALALALVLAFAAVEVVVGVLAESLALLADAGHMLADAGSLALALFAVWAADRPPTPERTFGYYRAEILAALANGVALVAISIWIFVEAIRRLGEPADPAGLAILVVGAAGLLVNLAVAAVMHGGRHGSLNLQAAFRHVVADALASVGVIAAAVLVLAAGWKGADPAVAIAIGLLVLLSSWSILRDSLSILLEMTPRGIDASEVGGAMAAADDVVDVHDLHIWTITSGFAALSAHVLCRSEADCHGVRRELERLLEERFGIDHTTLQVDHAPAAQASVELGEPYRRRTPLGRH